VRRFGNDVLALVFRAPVGQLSTQARGFQDRSGARPRLFVDHVFVWKFSKFVLGNAESERNTLTWIDAAYFGLRLIKN
jgi:hypothetical protein